jgi:hypothetical protein
VKKDAISFKDFKKVKSDKEYSILEHSKGHHIVIAHNGLSDGVRKELDDLPHFAAGGVVEETEEKKEQPEENNLPVFSSEPSLGAQLDPGMGAENVSTMPMMAPEAPVEREIAAEEVPTQEEAIPQEIDLQSPIVEAPQGSSLLKQAVSQEEKGLIAQAEEQQKVYQEQIQTMQKLDAEYQVQRQELMNERAALQADIANSHVDPRRYMGSMDNGKKTAVTIGLILAGLGTAAGEENPVMKMLQNNIDNDIKAQEKELGKKQTLLDANMRQMGDLKDAIQMTRINLMDMASMKLKEAELRTQSPLIKSRAAKARAEIDAKSNAASESLAQKRTAMMLAQTGGAFDPAQLLNHMGMSAQDLPKAAEEVQAAKDFNKAVKNIKALYKGVGDIGVIGANTPFSKSKAALESARAQITGIIRSTMKGQGVITDKDQVTVIDPYLPAGGDTPEQMHIKLDGLLNNLKNRLPGTPTLTRYGLDLEKFDSTRSAPKYAPGDVVKVKGKNYRVGKDGNSLEAI